MSSSVYQVFMQFTLKAEWNLADYPSSGLVCDVLTPQDFPSECLNPSDWESMFSAFSEPFILWRHNVPVSTPATASVDGELIKFGFSSSNNVSFALLQPPPVSCCVPTAAFWDSWPYWGPLMLQTLGSSEAWPWTSWSPSWSQGDCTENNYKSNSTVF